MGVGETRSKSENKKLVFSCKFQFLFLNLIYAIKGESRGRESHEFDKKNFSGALGNQLITKINESSSFSERERGTTHNLFDCEILKYK